MSKFGSIYSGKRKLNTLKELIGINYVDTEQIIVSRKYQIRKKK